MTKKRAIVALISAFAVIIGIIVFGGNAGATSYYDDGYGCYEPPETTTTTVYVEETTTTTPYEEPTTTVAPETTTTTVAPEPVPTTVPETPPTTTPDLPEPEIDTALVVELPPYIRPLPPVETPVTQTHGGGGANISFTG